MESLGTASQPSTLAYLDSGVIFLGSANADSQLIRCVARGSLWPAHVSPAHVVQLVVAAPLTCHRAHRSLHNQPPDPARPSNFLEVLDTITNLGPIVDLSVVDLDRQGQGQVVTCSGAGAAGSLRIVRSGVGVLEQAAVELPGVKGVWSLRTSLTEEHDTYLVLSFVSETRVLGLNEEDELDEAKIPGFDAEVQTVWCGNVVHDQYVQVTNGAVRLVDCATQQLITSWTPPAGKSIVVAAASPSQVVVATGEGHVAYIEIGKQTLGEVAHMQVDSEVSCLDITPIGANPDKADVLVVGTWSMELRLFSVPQLAEVARQPLGGEVMPRSVLFAVFDDVRFLLCGLGDGHLVSSRIEGTGFADIKKLALGTKPIMLKTFRSRGTGHVFAASDRPTIIYSANGKLLFSTLNENEVGRSLSMLEHV
jgi:DNA damage-binding protein 1